MTHLIDKDILVAEIERRIKRFRQEKDSVSIVKTNTYKGLLSFIDTLEMKEVDLEKAIEHSFIYHESHGDDFRSDKQIETAYKYGFESGAKWADEHSREVKEVDVENSFECNVCKNCNTYLKEMDKDAITKTLEPQERGGDEIIYTSSCEWCNRDSCEDCYDEED